MADFIPQQMTPPARFRHPNKWQILDIAGASPQTGQVGITAVASKHAVIGHSTVSNNGDGVATVTFNWDGSANFYKVIIPAGGVVLCNFLGIEPVSETANKALHVDVASGSTVAVSVTTGFFEVPT